MKNIRALSNIAGISVRRFVFLTVATAGIYPFLWLTNTQNRFFEAFGTKPWDRSLPTMIATIPSIALFLMLITQGSINGLICFLAIASYLGAWLYWSFLIRYEIISYAANNYGLKLEIYPGLLFLFGPAYIIHCINKIPLEYGVSEALKKV